MLGFEYGLRVGGPGCAGDLGGAVRGFCEHGGANYGPFVECGVEVGEVQRPGAAAAARLRGAGAGAFARAAGAFLAALCGRQHAGVLSDDAGEDIPFAAAAGAPVVPEAAGHHEPEEHAAEQAGGLNAGRVRGGRLSGPDRRNGCED